MTDDGTEKKKKGHKPSLPEEIFLRRDKVLQFMIGGITNRRTIADLLVPKVSPATVQSDIAALRQQLRTDNVTTMTNYSAMAIEQSNTIITALHPKVLRGDEEAIKVALDAMRYQADIIGLNGFLRDRQDKKDKAGKYVPREEVIANNNSVNLNIGSVPPEFQSTVAAILAMSPEAVARYNENAAAVFQNTPQNDD